MKSFYSLAFVFLFSSICLAQTNRVIKEISSINVVSILKYDPTKPTTFITISCPAGYEELVYCLQTTNIVVKVIKIKKGHPEMVPINTESVIFFSGLAKLAKKE